MIDRDHKVILEIIAKHQQELADWLLSLLGDMPVEVTATGWSQKDITFAIDLDDTATRGGV